MIILLGKTSYNIVDGCWEVALALAFPSCDYCRHYLVVMLLPMKNVDACRAVALAPIVDRGLSWFTVKCKFESQGKVRHQNYS